MGKLQRKADRIIGNKIFNHQIDGANDFIQFACAQGFIYRFKIAWAMIIGRPIRMERVKL